MSNKLFYGMAGLVLIVLCTCAAEAQNSSNIVASIVVVGNNRIDESVIRNTIKIKEGDYYSEDIAKEDTRSLMNLGAFESVDVEKVIEDDRVILTYRVREQFNIIEIDITGEKEINKKKIFNQIHSELNRPLSPATLKNDIERIRNLYAAKGLAQVSIDYVVEDTGDGENSRVVINIDEGPPSYVREITITGNEHISSTKIKFSMKTKARLGFLFGTYDEYTLKDDMWTITEMFQKEGFAEVQVSYELKPTEKGDGIAINISVVEGPRYYIEGITIKQGKLRGFYATNLLYEVLIYKGGIYSPQAIETDTENLRNYYRSMGYADVFVNSKVLQSPKMSPTNMLVDVYFEISESQLYDIGLIEIKGNTRTKDLVVRRELNVLPGDRYNYYRVETSRQRLVNLNYFSNVDVIETDSKTIPNAKDIQINVKEKLTGQLGLGIGYSSENLVFGTATLSQPNFDWKNWRNFFVGGGQKMMVKTEFGINRQDVVVSFTEPYFMYEKLRGRKVAFGLDFFARNNQALGPDMRIARIGGDIRLGTPVNFGWIPSLGKYIGTVRADLTVIGEYVNVDIGKSLDYDDYILGDDTFWVTRRRVNKKNGRVHKYRLPYNFERYDKYLKEDDGSYVQAAPEFAFTRDTRDNLILPTRGSKSMIKSKISLGTTSYGLMEAKHSHYFKLFDLYKHKPTHAFSGSHVLLVRGSIGYATDNTPIFDRFFVGGTEELRGFRYGMAGPKDYSGDNPLGGTSKLVGSVEYIFPVLQYSENISVYASVWFDAGNVWWKTRKYHRARPYGNNTYYVEDVTRSNAGEINGSVGGSIIMKMWRMPFRINYGFPIIKDSESRDVDPFDGFSFGTGFSF